MAAVPELEPLLAPGRTLRPEGHGIRSALGHGDTGARYDRRAVVYDRLVGNAAYNRLAWGTSPGQYAGFAAEAVEAGDAVGVVGTADPVLPGPMLDIGCGSATFTAGVYAKMLRPLVLVDRSLDMLTRADARIPSGRAALVQADLTDLPFREHRFAVVACLGVLHVLDDPWAALQSLRAQVAPGGHVFASMLVTDRWIGRWYLTALHRAGEVGPPRRADELRNQARVVFGVSCSVERTGSMAWLRATVQ